jgi:NADH-quinone oxidoreductase subunit C
LSSTDEPGTGDASIAELVDELRSALGDALVDTLVKPGDDVWVRVRSDAWRRAGEVLHGAGFEYFCFLSAIDWLPSPYGKGEDDPTEPPPERDDTIRQGYVGGESRYQVLARVYSIRRKVGINLKTDVPDDLVVDSWVPVYAGANWHERETWEMFGISFAGHPDQRHIYLPGDFEGFPLRKDFPLLSRIVKPWPGIVDVEPLPPTDEDEDEGEGVTAAAEGGEAS